MNDVVLQNVRVLAVDQIADERTEKPSVVKAVTLEVDVTGGQKLALAASVGTLSLAAAQGRRSRDVAGAPGDAHRSERRRRSVGRFEVRHRCGHARIDAEGIQRAGRGQGLALRRRFRASAGKQLNWGKTETGLKTTRRDTTCDKTCCGKTWGKLGTRVGTRATWGQQAAAGRPT